MLPRPEAVARLYVGRKSGRRRVRRARLSAGQLPHVTDCGVLDLVTGLPCQTIVYAELDGRPSKPCAACEERAVHANEHRDNTNRGDSFDTNAAAATSGTPGKGGPFEARPCKL